MDAPTQAAVLPAEDLRLALDAVQEAADFHRAAAMATPQIRDVETERAAALDALASRLAVALSVGLVEARPPGFKRALAESGLVPPDQLALVPDDEQPAGRYIIGGDGIPYGPFPPERPAP